MLYLQFLLCFSLLLSYSAAQDPQIVAVQGLIRRVASSYEGVFQLELIPSSSGDIFEIESNGTQIVLRGNTGVNIASALNYYLKYFCECHLSWTGNQLNLPTKPPTVPSLIRLPVPMTYRYYFNVCTFGYTTVWWNYTRWEQEIDWMALNGINLPLAFVGQEYVWRQVYLQLGLSDSDLASFFSGPAFLPWQRMGNVYEWGGPLPLTWIESRSQLQTLILAQMRSFGMKPVLPAFAGHVPPAMKKYFPSANITQLGGWNTFNGTFLLDPIDPLFSKITTMFIKLQTQTYGTDHYYNTDLFNEEEPPTNNPTYLSSVAKAAFNSIIAADSEAVWVMQGWFLFNDMNFWQPPQAEAFLTAIPTSNLLMLDLWAEENPVWNLTDKFYGRDFVWCMLHNFGGRSGIYGMLDSIASNPAITYSQAPNMVGMGLTPEAIETNVILYDLMMEMPWRIALNSSGLIGVLDTWVQNFTIRRYGEANQDAFAAWNILQNTLYNSPAKIYGATYSFIAARPQMSLSGQFQPYYDVRVVPQVLQLLLKASASPSVASQATFQHDISSVTRQMIGDSFLSFYTNMMNNYNSKNTTGFTQWSSVLLESIIDMDSVVSTQYMWLVGKWINDARQWGTSTEERALYEFNARNQLTLWGPATSGLHDYAAKLWGGLVRDFYYPRWHLFTSLLATSLQKGTPLDYDAFVTQVESLEYSWSTATNTYPNTPSGNAVALAGQMLAKYGVYDN